MSMWTRGSLEPVKVSAQHRLRLAPNGVPIQLERNGPPCPVCLNLDYKNKPEEERERWGNYLEFELIGAIEVRNLNWATSSDCGYCAILLKLIEHFEIYRLVDTDCVDLSILIGSQLELAIGTDFRVEISVHSPFCQAPEIIWSSFNEFAPFGEVTEILWARFGQSRCLNFAAGSKDGGITFVKDKLENCLKYHSGCKNQLQPLPTRLLFIGDGTDSLKLSISDKASLGRYAALSHCWGKLKILQLTKGNEESMKVTVSWKSLPNTFQDAVTVCQNLGIDYLWIDSLCIIQDDKQDWDREGARMADVYENAHLTIAASASSSPDESFLAIRRQGRCEPIVIAWTDNSEPLPLLKARRIPMLGHHQQLEFDELRDPLQQRAWAFQEHLLSRRFASFTSEEIQWECPAARSCECKNGVNFPADKGPMKSVQDWLNVIQRYSPLSITYLSDKLPALSGVASRFQQNLASNYFAGLWFDHTLVQQLSWSRARTPVSPGDHQIEVDDPTYRYPTFSWASADGLVYCWGPPEREYVQILEGGLKLKGQNPFGEVTDAYLKVRGRILQAQLQMSDNLLYYMHFPEVGDLRGHCFQVLRDGSPSQIYLTQRKSPKANIETTQPGRSFYWSMSPTRQCTVPIVVWLLRLLEYKWTNEEKWLILVQSCRAEVAFERVALWYIAERHSECDRKDYLKLVALWSTLPEQEIIIV